MPGGIGYLILLLLSKLLLIVSQDAYRIIYSPSGPIQGYLVNVAGTPYSVYQYKGIPYAQPPIGQLRFKKPKKISPWTTLLDAKNFRSICPQLGNSSKHEISENCLFLNIYQPDNSVSDRPVMVYIHGGGYRQGAGYGTDGSYLASFGDVIVVTINYRLGFLGFMSTMDSESPGNYGLWDQHVAITWVKDNIVSFGGNPSSITIFGVSAGGFSVAMQSLYPGNNNLFQSIIAESGVATSPLATATTPEKAAFRVGDVLGCNTSLSSELVACLKGKDFNDLVRASSNYSDLQTVGSVEIALFFAPVVDGDFLLDEPIRLLMNHSSDAYRFYSSLNMIVGNVNTEGSILYTRITTALRKLSFNISEGIPTSFVCNDLVPAIVYYHYSNNSNISNMICDFYKVSDRNASGMASQARSAIDLYGDVFFYAPSIVNLKAHTQSRNTYQYLFTMSGNFNQPFPHWFEGDHHGSEVIYLFGLQKNPNATAEQLKVSTQLLKYWTNFAKTGDPNGNNLETDWPRFTNTTQTYLNLKSPLTPENKLFKDRMDLWNRKIPEVINQSLNV